MNRIKENQFKSLWHREQQKLKQDVVRGSLLTLHDVQMIIPMAALTRLGYEVKWMGSGCKINSPDGAQLPVQLDQGCPTLPYTCLGVKVLDILQQVEVHQRRETQMKLAAIRTNCGTAQRPVQKWKMVKRLKVNLPRSSLRIWQKKSRVMPKST